MDVQEDQIQLTRPSVIHHGEPPYPYIQPDTDVQGRYIGQSLHRPIKQGYFDRNNGFDMSINLPGMLLPSNTYTKV